MLPAWQGAVDAYVTGVLSDKGVPGMSVAVVIDGSIAWAHGFGLAEVENEGSGAAGNGVSDRFDFQDRDRRWPDEAGGRGETGTRRLRPGLGARVPRQRADDHDPAPAGPSFGLRPFSEEEYLSRTHYESLVDSLSLFKDDRLRAAPGSRFVYSTYGYTLLGIVAERISGLTFGAFCRERVFEPLGMASSRVEDEAAIVPHRAGGYRRTKSGTLRRCYVVDLSARLPGDGMMSSAEDLAAFASGLMNGKLLSEQTFRRMTLVYTTTTESETRYALGWFVREHHGRRIIGHSSGPTPGASAFLMLYPDSKGAVVVLANLAHLDTREIALHIAELCGLAPEADR